LVPTAAEEEASFAFSGRRARAMPTGRDVRMKRGRVGSCSQARRRKKETEERRGVSVDRA
jgi:hypothetical protein